MFLSRLKFSLACRETSRLLGDVYALHSAILRAFPNREAGGPGRVLYRVEPVFSLDPSCVEILVQSEKKPAVEEWAVLPLYDPVEGPKKLEKDKMITSGQTLFFRLRANPTVKKQGKRYPIVGEENLRKWLERKFEAGGCLLIEARVIPEGKARSKQKQILLNSVLFEGILSVKNEEAAMKMIEKGIGPAKGFGFGLLSVARV